MTGSVGFMSRRQVDLTGLAGELSRRLEGCRFGPPVERVYRPLEYAREPHFEYLRRFGGGPRRVLLLGMNPGPWGMAQTVPRA